MDENQKKSILEMGRGAIQERADYEMARIIDNIIDPNTNPTEKRKLTLTIEFIPDDRREMVAVKVTAKSALAPTVPISTSLYLTADGPGNSNVTAVELTPNIPGQMMMDGADQEPPAILRIVGREEKRA